MLYSGHTGGSVCLLSSYSTSAAGVARCTALLQQLHEKPSSFEWLAMMTFNRVQVRFRFSCKPQQLEQRSIACSAGAAAAAAASVPALLLAISLAVAHDMLPIGLM